MMQIKINAFHVATVAGVKIATVATFGVCAWLSLLSAIGYAEDSRPPTEAPAAGTKTHALPADATATVILFDYRGGMLEPQNDDPLMVIRADGSVTLGDRYRKNARIETRITKDDLHALLQLAIDTNDFFKINAAEIEQSIDAKVNRENEKLAAQGVVMVGPSAICDAATTVVRIHADGKDHEVQLYALDIKSRFLQNDERLTRLQNIVTRLSELNRKLRAGATKAEPGAAQQTPAAAPKTHALPADATATVILFDYRGGMLKPQNDDPLMVIRADGSVTLGDRYRKNARIETRITKDDLHALLQLTIDTNDFFKINAAEIEQSIDAKVKRENEKLAAQGVVMVGPSAICDAATTVVRIHADGKDHEVQLYALDIKSDFLQNDERLTRLQNIATRLTELERKLRAEAAAAAPPGKAEPR
jgi:tyrosine-protein phosphatase YwqE